MSKTAIDISVTIKHCDNCQKPYYILGRIGKSVKNFFCSETCWIIYPPETENDPKVSL